LFEYNWIKLTHLRDTMCNGSWKSEKRGKLLSCYNNGTLGNCNLEMYCIQKHMHIDGVI